MMCSDIFSELCQSTSMSEVCHERYSCVMLSSQLLVLLSYLTD